MMQEEQPLQVACCTKIIYAGEDEAKYMIIVKQIPKFVVGLGEKLLRLLTELDRFDPLGNTKVLMATIRLDTLDPALMRRGLLDRKAEFNLPELEGRTRILKILAESMNCDRGIRLSL
ncbi:hypothetical protein PsorP6_012952 [Peronosclerospora sorghi]|uniref:Uncharacterized protein n=1 Tax=Peronosclerospora sorghi TaxID=230839 RepID=A0ACC0WFB0_9STRA|nr:hypothetical protein PsorP6_012952 [Peronosclerospora sorghi]